MQEVDTIINNHFRRMEEVDPTINNHFRGKVSLNSRLLQDMKRGDSSNHEGSNQQMKGISEGKVC